MSIFKRISLYALLCLAHASYAQTTAVKTVVIKGQVPPGDTSQLYVFTDEGPDLSGTDFIIPTPSGHFRKTITLRLNYTGNTRIYGDICPGFSLYLLQCDSLELTWNGQSQWPTMKSWDKNKAQNDFLLKYSETFSEKEEALYENIDTATSLNSLERMVARLYEEEADYLVAEGTQLNEAQYLACAYDLFYSKLSLLTTSPFFKDYDFSDQNQMLRYPPFAIRTKKYVQSFNAKYQQGLKENPQAKAGDSLIIRRLARLSADLEGNAAFSVTNGDALKKSAAYRNYLDTYVSWLESINYYGRVGANTRTTVARYQQWLRGITDDEACVQALTASKIANKVVTEGVNMTQATLQQDLAMLSDKTIKQQLTTLYEKYDLQRAGKMAPDFKFVDANGVIRKLSDLRGKYIYITFWDSYCGPCIYDITNYGESAAAKHPDIVFLYISMDEKNATWKASLDKYHPAGINGRLPQGWADPAVKDYYIRYIPRHVIIRPDGTIVNGQAPGLQGILGKNPFTDAVAQPKPPVMLNNKLQ